MARMYVDLLNIHVMQIPTSDDGQVLRAGMEKLTKSDKLRLAIAR